MKRGCGGEERDYKMGTYCAIMRRPIFESCNFANERAYKVFLYMCDHSILQCVYVWRVCVCDLLVLLMCKPKTLPLPTQLSHFRAHACVGWKGVFARACVCINVCVWDILQ